MSLRRILDALVVAELLLVAVILLQSFTTGQPVAPEAFVRPLFLVLVAFGVSRGLAPWHLGYVLLGAESLLRAAVEAPRALGTWTEIGLITALGAVAVVYHLRQGFGDGFSPTIGEELRSWFTAGAAPPTPAVGSPVAEARADLPHLERRRERESPDGGEEIWVSEPYGHTITLGVLDDVVAWVKVELPGDHTAPLLASLRASLARHQQGPGFRVVGRTPQSIRFEEPGTALAATWTLPHTLTFRARTVVPDVQLTPRIKP
ncbi:MAG: hypothetical protein AAF211_07310 [Myxococcota bacterium]